jgi:pyruvate dehydrogenase E2 component (dihydrolipoamide acetyltransferase)
MKIFHLPDLGEGLAEAEIREWYVKAGDTVKVDQPLVSMETAKAVVDVPSPYAGKIAELHGKVNEVIPTGAALITFDTGDSVQERPKNTVVGALEESSKKWEEQDVVVATRKATATIKALPAARVLAQQMNVDLSQVTPSGPQGLITPDDVKKYLTQGKHHAPAAQSTEGVTIEALHGVRRMMSLAMTQSHQEIVPVTVIEDADVSNLPANTDITVALLKAIIAGCKAEPALNAWFDGKTLTRKLVTAVNIGLAVDTAEGLFVPVIKDAEMQDDKTLRVTIDHYKKAVRDRSLSPTDMQGTTITLSNFGMIAGRYATPIIVPPAVAILACGRTREVPIVRDGKIVIGRLMPLSLTFDHRAVTGGEATRFLGAVLQALK